MKAKGISEHSLGSVLAATVIFLSGCASGGMGGDMASPVVFSPSPQLPTDDAPSIPPISSDDPANTVEFRVNYGLRSINAHDAYARGVSGEGVTVAVIDDGIDTDHPDLDDNISPLSLDIRTGSFDDLATPETHGTQVAGIIAAERNELGGHGVAYGAEVLAIRALDADGSVADIVQGVDYARQSGARILNLSLTVDTLPFELREALDRAVDDGMLLVLSAGNNLADSPDRNTLDALSTYATFASAKGQGLAVGAIDDQNSLFSLSNRPGPKGANVYLLAPGVDIVSTTVGGGLYELTPGSNPDAFGVDLDASGTSFAAPHVAGAAAVLWEMFPNLSASEVAELLLETAVDVGVSGADAVTGRGIIDLGAATAPQGALSISLGATSFAKQSPVSETRLYAGSPFGNAFERSHAFEGGLAQDAYRRAYAFDYRHLVSAPQASLDVEAIVRARRGLHSGSVQISPSTTFYVSAEQAGRRWGRTETDPYLHLLPEMKDERALRNIALSTTRLLPDGSVFTTSVGGAHPSFVEVSLETPRPGLIPSGALKSVHDIASGGASAAWRKRLSSGAFVNLRYVTRAGTQYTRHAKSRLEAVELGLSSAVGENMQIAIAAGRLSEQNSALGMVGTGAFDGMRGAFTDYFQLGASAGRRGWSAFARMEVGATKIDLSSDGLFEDFSVLWSSSFALGARFQGMLLRNDDFYLSVSQPLRVESGEGLLSLATEIDRFDRLRRTSREISLTPDAREIMLRANYAVALDRLVVSGEYLLRRNPSHRRRTQSETVLMLMVSSRF